MVTTDGEETVALVMRRGYSILTIYEYALKPYIKLPSHMPKYQTHRKEEAQSG